MKSEALSNGSKEISFNEADVSQPLVLLQKLATYKKSSTISPDFHHHILLVQPLDSSTLIIMNLNNSIIALAILTAIPTTSVAEPSVAEPTTSSPKLEKLWQTEATLLIPESVLYDAKRKLLYVSNIDGKNSWEDDGKGSIGKVSLDGKVINPQWVTGLNGPKGMGTHGNYLYVTDNRSVVTIDIEKATIINRLPIPNAAEINDLSVAEDGTIYITDSKLGNLHKLINGKITTLITGRKALNGVLHSQGELLFVDSGCLFKLDDNKTVTKIASGMEGHTDGVERIDKDSWLVSCWGGTVYHVTRTGKVSLLLDGRPTETSAADLGYDPVNKIAYFPAFFKNFVHAYKLKGVSGKE